jgi:hypothetical protein
MTTNSCAASDRHPESVNYGFQKMAFEALSLSANATRGSVCIQIRIRGMTRQWPQERSEAFSLAPSTRYVSETIDTLMGE